jgi:hypothetical protein
VILFLVFIRTGGRGMLRMRNQQHKDKHPEPQRSGN